MTAAGTPSTDEENPNRVLAMGAILVVSLGAVIRGIDGWLSNPMQATVLGAVVVSFAMGRAGVPSARGGGRAWRRAIVSAGVVFVILAVAAGVAVAAGGSVSSAQPSAAVFFGIIESVFLALRDEVWLHGIPLTFAARARLPLRYGAIFAVLASVAAVALERSATPVGLALVATSSAAFVALWLKGRDAWAPIGAHFAFSFGADALLGGELLAVGPGAGNLTAGPSAHGIIAIVASLGFAALAAGAPRLPIPQATQEEMSDEPAEKPKKKSAKKKRKKKAAKPEKKPS